MAGCPEKSIRGTVTAKAQRRGGAYPNIPSGDPTPNPRRRPTILQMIVDGLKWDLQNRISYH
jgi:hypothetical protein